MRLTDEQCATVERYAEWAQQLAFSPRISLPRHVRCDLRQDLCLHAIRVVLTYRGDVPLHAVLIHGLQMRRRQWLTDRARRRSSSEEQASWLPGDATPADDPGVRGEPPARGDRLRDVEDRDEIAHLIGGLKGFRGDALVLRYCYGMTRDEAAARLGLRRSWVAEETRAGLAEARERANRPKAPAGAPGPARQ